MHLFVVLFLLGIISQVSFATALPHSFLTSDEGSLFSLNYRKMAFSAYSPGKTIKATKIRTTQQTTTTYGYLTSTSPHYVVESEALEHTLWEFSWNGRIATENIYSRSDNPLFRWGTMTNLYPSLLLGSGLEYFQARFAADYALVWNPIARLLLAPAIGAYYAYFGNTWKFTAEPASDAAIDDTDELYTVYDATTNKHYLFIFGPQNFGLYYGIYLEILALNFLDISTQWMISLYDTPILTRAEELNKTSNSLAIPSTSKTVQHRLQVKLLFYLRPLGIDFKYPISLSYQDVRYPSIGLQEKGFGLGIVTNY